MKAVFYNALLRFDLVKHIEIFNLILNVNIYISVNFFPKYIIPTNNSTNIDSFKYLNVHY